MSEPREWVWVPEDHVFDGAPECLEKFPDAGPACRFPTQVAYDALAEKLKACEAELIDVNQRYSNTYNEIIKERDQLRERVRDEKNMADSYSMEVEKHIETIAALRAQVAELMRALEHYDDKTLKDPGNYARKVLAKYAKGEK
jgi:uncharacterized coiled-coil DUF342 family protein